MVEVFNQFNKRLLLNYLVGSIMTIIGVGVTFLYSAVTINSNDSRIIILIILISTVNMIIFEGFYFRKHMNPIKRVFQAASLNEEMIYEALLQLQKFPLLTVKRILLPHFLGLCIPAACLGSFFIMTNKLQLPIIYIGYAFVGAFLIISMHALIEYYLTTLAVQPVASLLKTKLASEIYLENKIVVSIKKKFQITILLIGIIPTLIFLLASQVKLASMTEMNHSVYWQWAGVILCITIPFAVLMAKFLTLDIERPIQQLQIVMKNAQQQNYQYVTSNVYTDEFSQVISGFNYMIQTIKQREEANKQLLESFMAVLSTALDARDPYTSGHSIRVASFTYEIGRSLSMDEKELQLLYQTALLHDIGKIGVPDAVLLKEGKLTEEEFSYIKAHPLIGENIIKQVQPAHKVQALLPGIRSHHERIDGKGYPDGLKGSNIPFSGRIIAVADAFDAMTSDRPYRKGMSINNALHILEQGKGTQWDEEIVNVFSSVIRKKQSFAKYKNIKEIS